MQVSGLHYIYVTLLLALSAFLLGRCRGGVPAASPGVTGVTEVRDTMVVRETLRVAAPIVTRTYVRDTMVVAVTDTVVRRDTVWAYLPREVREYRDTTYRAIVSGYRPSLDTIEVYPTTREIRVTEMVRDTRRWGVGISAGYGAAVQGGDVHLSPYIGVGVTYTLFRVGKR